MNIIRRELRAHFKALVIWCLSLGAIIAIATSEFEAFYNNPEMLEIMNQFPEGMLAAFGMNGVNLTTVAGFISMFSIYFYLVLSIHAGLLGSSIVSKEERDKTAEYLFTLPVTRNKVLLGKMVASIISCLIFLTVTMLITIAATARFNPPTDYYRFLGLMSIGLFVLQLIFMSIGMLLASILEHYKKSGSYTLGILLGTYMLSVLISMSSSIDFLKYITPFKYFEAAVIVNEMKLEPVNIILSVVIIALCITGVFTFYKKRDLYI